MQKDRLLPDGRLFSQARYPTKITAADLPESFVYGRFYKRWSYLDTAGIKDMIYVPNLWVNHFLKDDKLVISYTGKLKEIKRKEEHWSWTEYENEDFTVWGNEIIDVLKGARDYSGIDIKPFIKQLKNKLKVLREKHPEEFGDYDPDLDKIFKKPFTNYDDYMIQKSKEVSDG